MIIYAICLVLGLMFTLLSAFLGHLFGGHDSVGTGGHADAGFERSYARGFVHTGENREQTGLAYHGQANDGCLHWVGTSMLSHAGMDCSF